MPISPTPGELLLRVDAAFRARDLDGLIDCYEKDAIVVVRLGVLACGWAEIREAFVRILATFERHPDVRHERTSFLETGDVALLSSRWTLYSGDTALMTRYATSVLRRDSAAGWRLVVDNAHGPQLLLEDAGLA